MPAPVSFVPSRPDCDVIHVPNLSEFLGLVAASDAAVWASYVDYKTVAAKVQK